MPNVNLPEGKYVVAVSGGVDSMSLLDILRRQKKLDLVVAHFNHGIRKDAKQDEDLVRRYAMSHNIKFVSKQIKLGPHAGEDIARRERYAFLRYCRDRFNANFIVTAQHQDDLVETAIINLLRGTDWRGIAPFATTSDVLRPLLDYKKSDLIAYAQKYQVPWREDSTNQDRRHLRNYVRLDVLPVLEKRGPGFREEILRLIRRQQQLRQKIEQLLDKQVALWPKNVCERHVLIMFPAAIAYEVLQQVLRNTRGSSVVGRVAEKMLLFAKVAAPGKSMPIDARWQVRATTRQLIVEPKGAVVS
jgi:tRNA(Ile)-lysidine synthase